MHHLLRPVAVLATAAVIATTLTAPAQAAPAADARSAGWLERQLTDGLVVNESFDEPFNDYGLTADVALGLDAIGGQRATVRRIGNALAPRVNSWTTGVDFGSNDIFAGSVAKAVVLAQSAERDPRRFGGVNLITRLNRRVSETAPYVGRVEDRSETDFVNSIGQLFAAVGLAGAGSPKARPVLKFLLRQQCSEGFFRLNFAGKNRPRQGCDAGNTVVSAPDTDVTALAVIALTAMPKQGRAVRKATSDAVQWLRQAQKRNGSFGGGVSTETSNTNSTGLAAWALGDAGACGPAVKAARWVRRLQVTGNLAGTPLAGERGAIAYDRTALTAAESDGITVEARDQWRRATAQAAPGLTFTSLARCRR